MVFMRKRRSGTEGTNEDVELLAAIRTRLEFLVTIGALFFLTSVTLVAMLDRERMQAWAKLT